MKKFICTVCGYIHEGDAAPEKCPLCKAPASKFNEMVETEGGSITNVPSRSINNAFFIFQHS
jgi:hypothetical protein